MTGWAGARPAGREAGLMNYLGSRGRCRYAKTIILYALTVPPPPADLRPLLVRAPLIERFLPGARQTSSESGRVRPCDRRDRCRDDIPGAARQLISKLVRAALGAESILRPPRDALEKTRRKLSDALGHSWRERFACLDEGYIDRRPSHWVKSSGDPRRAVNCPVRSFVCGLAPGRGLMLNGSNLTCLLTPSCVAARYAALIAHSSQAKPGPLWGVQSPPRWRIR